MNPVTTTFSGLVVWGVTLPSVAELFFFPINIANDLIVLLWPMEKYIIGLALGALFFKILFRSIAVIPAILEKRNAPHDFDEDVHNLIKYNKTIEGMKELGMTDSQAKSMASKYSRFIDD